MAKVYTQVYDISQPTEQRFWTPPFSNFKIGLKVTNKGEEVQGALSLKAGDTVLSAEETEIDGFTIFPVSSTSAGSTVYTLSAEGVPETMKLVQVTTGSTVFEIDEKGSGGGTVDAYTKAETDALLSTKADETELTAYATKAELTGYVENDDLTAYYTKSETSSATELADAFAGAGGGAISAFDLSESPVWSKTQVEAAVANDICLPQTIFQFEDNTLSVADIEGELNVKPPQYIKKLLIGTKCNVFRTASYSQWAPFNIVIPSSVSAITTEQWLNVKGTMPKQPIIIPDNIVYMTGARYSNDGWSYMDFGNTRTTVPRLMASWSISGNKLYVPDALYDTWITTSPWNNLSANIYRHSELEAPYLYSSKVTGGAETGTTGTPAAVNAVKSVYETDWQTLSATADANTFYVVLPDPA